MNIILKKNKMPTVSVDEYMSSISNKVDKNITISNKSFKINDNDVIIPTINTYENITKYNYNLSQLKTFAKHYKLKISGSKNDLLKRIYIYLYFSSQIIKIQRVFRGMIVKKYNELHGPASINRKLCTNSSDFITLEPIEEINYHQFLSYKDLDGFIYGFDIGSLQNLYLKSGRNIKNPYNRSLFPIMVFKNINSIIQLSKILKIHVNLLLEDDTQNFSGEKIIEMRTLTLFQNIDSLGNYSDYKWFLSLNRIQIIKFVRELTDIWNYRAQLSNEIKRNICPPNGDPFRNLSTIYVHTEANINNVRKVVLEVLEKLVNTGTNKDNKTLGAYYVLGALTLVNEPAATALPWLFQSMSYFG